MKNVVIAGGGDVGFSLARALSEEGHNVSVIDIQEEVAVKLEALDVLVVIGNAASPGTLNKAYINSADVLIAVTASDEVNMACCAIAKNRGCNTLARINNEEYVQEPISTEALKDCGIDLAFCPELISATHMSNVLSVRALFDSPVLQQKTIRLVENRVAKGSKAVGKEIRKIGLPREINLVAIFRNEEVVIPRGSVKLRSNDRVISILPQAKEKKLVRKLNLLYGTSRKVDMKKTIDKVMIAGGSRVGLHLARVLDEKKLSVVLIEESGSICEELAEKLPGVLVIEGSPADKEVLKDEGVSEADAFLAVTDREEVNILTSLLASQLGAGKSISLVDRPGLKSSLEEMGIDLVISPRSVTISTILKYFHQEDFDSLAILNQGEAQVIQIKVKEKSKGANSRLDSIVALRTKDILVGAIIREKNLLIPRGDTFIHPGDMLIVITRSMHLKWVKDHFTR